MPKNEPGLLGKMKKTGSLATPARNSTGSTGSVKPAAFYKAGLPGKK